MSQDSNRWLKMAGLLNETVDPSENTLSEAAEPKQDAVLVEEKVRKMVRKQIKSILAERAARKEDISYLQGILNTLLGDNTVAIDGILGPKTANAIAQLQRDAGLEPDGVVGPKTYTAMASALDAKGIDSELALGELMADVPVIGKDGLVDAPAAPASDRDLEMPTMNISAGPGAERDEEVAKLALQARGFLDGEEKMSNQEFIAFMDNIGLPLSDKQKDDLYTMGQRQDTAKDQVEVEDVEEVSPEMKKKIDQVTKDLIKNLD